MARTRILAALLLCLAGGALSLVLLSKHYGVPLLGEAVLAACGEDGGCDVVSQSRYAIFLGLPLAAWGLFFYGSLLALLAPSALGSPDESADSGLSLAFFLGRPRRGSGRAPAGPSGLRHQGLLQVLYRDLCGERPGPGRSCGPSDRLRRPRISSFAKAPRRAFGSWAVATLAVAAAALAGNAALDGPEGSRRQFDPGHSHHDPGPAEGREGLLGGTTGPGPRRGEGMEGHAGQREQASVLSDPEGEGRFQQGGGAEPRPLASAREGRIERPHRGRDLFRFHVSFLPGSGPGSAKVRPRLGRPAQGLLQELPPRVELQPPGRTHRSSRAPAIWPKAESALRRAADSGSITTRSSPRPGSAPAGRMSFGSASRSAWSGLSLAPASTPPPQRAGSRPRLRKANGWAFSRRPR